MTKGSKSKSELTYPEENHEEEKEAWKRDSENKVQEMLESFKTRKLWYETYSIKKMDYCSSGMWPEEQIGDDNWL